MSHCSPRCCNGCQTKAREERKILKKEATSINACCSGPFPATVEVSEEEDLASDKPTASDIPCDIEEGDQVWALDSYLRHSNIHHQSEVGRRLCQRCGSQPYSSDWWKRIGRLGSRLCQDFQAGLFERRFCEAPELKTLGSCN